MVKVVEILLRKADFVDLLTHIFPNGAVLRAFPVVMWQKPSRVQLYAYFSPGFQNSRFPGVMSDGIISAFALEEQLR